MLRLEPAVHLALVFQKSDSPCRTPAPNRNQPRRLRHAGHRIPDLPVLADRCAVVARPARGGARSVHRRAAAPQPLRLLSEDVDPQTGALWGNFPQTYSMAGLILSAMRLSRSWEDRYWRG